MAEKTVTRYKIAYAWWEAVVAVDPAKGALAAMRSSLYFWTSGRDRLEAEAGEVIPAFLKFLGEELLSLSQSADLALIRKRFDSREGFPTLRGESGITLESVDMWEFERVTVAEIP